MWPPRAGSRHRLFLAGEYICHHICVSELFIHKTLLESVFFTRCDNQSIILQMLFAFKIKVRWSLEHIGSPSSDLNTHEETCTLPIMWGSDSSPSWGTLTLLIVCSKNFEVGVLSAAMATPGVDNSNKTVFPLFFYVTRYQYQYW